MKANRKFKNKDDDAVSAVIGVILMVAITVAIAATVYVYVSGMIGSSPAQTPSMQFVKDDVNDKLTVASADPGDLQWSSFSITVSPNTKDVHLANITGDWKNVSKGGQLDSDNTATAFVDSYEFGTVEAGDYFKWINGTCTISIRHIDTNTLIGTWDFN